MKKNAFDNISFSSPSTEAEADSLNLSLRNRLRAALAEDLASDGDVTTNAIFPAEARGTAKVVSKADGILCGGLPFGMVFDLLGEVEVTQFIPDGEQVSPGDVAFELSGSVRSLLAGERTALNLLQHLSGVATQTNRFVQAVKGKIAICDTRKTSPLWRDLQKQAVYCGGGTNHRMGLFDMVMIKDTHADGAGSLANAIARVKHLQPGLKIAAETRNLEEVQMALDGGVDLVMLDNMGPGLLDQAIEMISGRIATEITGGVTLENIHLYVGKGVDRISIGAVTHSVTALDFSMRLVIK